MPKIQRREVIKELIDGCRLDESREVMPSQVAEKIVPTFTCNEKPEIQVATAVQTATGSTTIKTTSSIKRTFLHGFTLSVVQLVATAGVNPLALLNITAKGKAAVSNIGRIKVAANVATQDSISLSFPSPIELEKGTNIVIQVASSNASSEGAATILFSEKEAI